MTSARIKNEYCSPSLFFFNKCLFKFQHSFAYLAFIWLFLEAASLAVIGSGRVEGIGEFLEKKIKLFICFHFNCRKFYWNTTNIFLNFKSTVCEKLFLHLFTLYKLTHILPNLICKYHYVLHTNVTSLFVFQRNPWKKNRTIL